MKSEQPITQIKRIPKIRKSGIIIFCILIVIVTGLTYLFLSAKSNKTSAVPQLRTATASNQDLSQTITGSGPLISANLVDIAAKTSGTIRKLYFKQGDKVKAGQVICDLDTSDALSNLQNAKNNLQQAEYTQQQNQTDLKNLTVRAPITGQITSLAVSQGDITQRNGVLLTLTDTKHMDLVVPFNGSDISGVKVGSKAIVYIQSGMESLTGRVAYITNAPYSTNDGGALYNVDIALNNPGSLSEGMKASADIVKGKDTVSSADTGALTYTSKVTVRTTTGGTVNKINVKLYQEIKKDDIIMALDNTDVISAYQTNSIKIDGLKQQVDNSQKNLGYCSMVSPISGTITALDFKEGETLKMGDVLTSVTDVNHMQFDIPVDELDIAKVKIGQKADISVDALTETSTLPLTGEVKDIAVEGSSSNGVSTYNVTVAVTGVTDPRTLFASMRQQFGGGSNSGQGNGGFGSGGNGFNRQNGSGGNGYNRQSGSGNGNTTGNSGGQGNGSGNNRRNGGQGSNGGFSGMMGQNGSSGSMRNFARFDTSSLLSSLKDGMNANATIYITENKGVLAVPLEAVTRINGQNYVMVKSDTATVDALKKSGKYIDLFSNANSSSNNSSSQSSNNNQSGNSSNSNSGRSGRSSGRNSLIQNKEYYKDTIPTVVQVGANTDSYIQITSGLKAGDVVVLPPLIQSSGTNSTGRSGIGGFGMFGGGGGGGGNFGGGQNRNNNRTSSGNGSSPRSGGGN